MKDCQEKSASCAKAIGPEKNNIVAQNTANNSSSMQAANSAASTH
jgi:hypothetical protein